MDDPRAAVDPTAQKRLQIQRRAKRGFIAGYIHGLSVRHGAEAAPQPRPDELHGVGADGMLDGDRSGVA